MIYTYQSRANLATLRQVRFINRELRTIHRTGANKREYRPSNDDNLGPGATIDHEPRRVQTLNSKAKLPAKRNITGTPDELMEAREAEFTITDVWERSMRRDEAPFVFPVTRDPELEGCDDLLRARRRGYALVRYQPHYLTTLIRMRTPFLEKQSDKKKRGTRTSPDFSSPALTRSELRRRQTRAEARQNEDGISGILNLKSLWHERTDEDMAGTRADDESEQNEQPQVERRRTRSSARASRSDTVHVDKTCVCIFRSSLDVTRRQSSSSQYRHQPQTITHID